MAPSYSTQSMTLVWPPAVRGDPIENLVWLGHGIFFTKALAVTPTNLQTLSFFFLDCVGPDGKPKQVRNSAWHIHSCTLEEHELCVWTSLFLFTSLVTHGQVTATPVCVTRIPWASSVSLFSAHQYRAPTVASPASSWSTRQTAAAQHRHVVSCSATELLVILSLCAINKVTESQVVDGSKNLP